MMEQAQNHLEQRLNKMKAINFSEQKQAQLVRKIFYSLQAMQKERVNKYRQYYNMILCIKSFKGIMEFALMQRQIQQRKLNQQKLLQQVQNATQDERIKQLIQTILIQRKANYFRRFCQSTKAQVQERKDKQKQKQQIENKAKNSNIIELRQKYPEPVSPKRLYESGKFGTPFLQNSRRSIQTLRQDYQTKRKYAAIKALPPKPIQNMEFKAPSAQIVDVPVAAQKIAYSQKKNDKPTQNPNQIKLKTFEKSQNQQSSAPIQSEIPIQKKQQSSNSILKIKKNEILGLLSEIKMIEIIQIAQIIQEKDKVFKNQANLSEKQFIKQGLKLLQRISLIN